MARLLLPQEGVLGGGGGLLEIASRGEVPCGALPIILLVGGGGLALKGKGLVVGGDGLIVVTQLAMARGYGIKSGIERRIPCEGFLVVQYGFMIGALPLRDLSPQIVGL